MNEWFLDILKHKYADFNGRARRKEFWMFSLFYFIILFATLMLAVIGGAISETLGALLIILPVLVALGLVVPSLAISVRRLHDTGHSGWFILLNIIPIINWVGWIVLLVFYCTDSEPGDNQYGPNPKESAS
jgi:uncharacterized membrane protein YhaH (DUF805 family)